MKYKIGDRVKIVDWKTVIKVYGDIDKFIYEDNSHTQFLKKYCGKTVTITKVCEKIECYRIEEDNGSWLWYKSMIEGLATPDIELSANHLTKGKNNIYTIKW